MRHVNVHLVRFGAPPIEQRAGLERIGAVRQAGRHGEIGLPPLIVNGHSGVDLAQLLEFRYSDIFIQVKVAVIALSRAGVGAEEVHACVLAERHRITSTSLAKSMMYCLKTCVYALLADRKIWLRTGGDGINHYRTASSERNAGTIGLLILTHC